MTTIFVPGKAEPRGRLRQSSNGSSIKSKPVEDYERYVKVIAKNNFKSPKGGFVSLNIQFLMQRTKYPHQAHPLWNNLGRAWCSKGGQALNLAEVVIDSIDGIAFKSKSQIVSVQVTKLYAAAGERFGTNISVEDIKSDALLSRVEQHESFVREMDKQ